MNGNPYLQDLYGGVVTATFLERVERSHSNNLEALETQRESGRIDDERYYFLANELQGRIDEVRELYKKYYMDTQSKWAKRRMK